MRIKADRYNKYKKEGLYEMGEDFPVDLYGKRIFPNKSDSNNLKNAGEDIQKFYDLEPLGLGEDGE